MGVSLMDEKSHALKLGSAACTAGEELSRIFPIEGLDCKVLAYWDALDFKTVTRDAKGRVSAWRDKVAGLLAVQPDEDAKPTFSFTSFANDPALSFAGDQYLAVERPPLPDGDAACEIWALVQQDSTVEDATVRYPVAYGSGTTSGSRRLRRSVVGDRVAGSASLGTGHGAATAEVGQGSLLGRAVMRGIFGTGCVAAEIDGFVSGVCAAVPSTPAVRLRIGASDHATVANHWVGQIAAIVITQPLLEGEAVVARNYLGWRRRPNRDLAYLSPKTAGLDASRMIAGALGNYSTVVLMEGTHTAAKTTLVSRGRELRGQPGARLRLSEASAANDVIEMKSGAHVDGLVIDGNLAKREADGFVGYTHGLRVTNERAVTISNCGIRDVGETETYGRLFGTAIFVERTSSAAEDVDAIRIVGNFIDDVSYKLPFAIRLKTDFASRPSRGQQGHRLRDAIVRGNRIVGTTKNAIEVVGPDTIADVIGNDLRCPAGQGGMEFDFGASGTMRGNTVSQVGRNGVMGRSFDAFSVRCGEYNDATPGLSPQDARMVENVLRDSVQVGKYYLRLAVDFGADGTEWTGMRMIDVIKAENALPARIFGYVANPRLRAVVGARIAALKADGADVLAGVISPSYPVSDLRFRLPARAISRILAETPMLSSQHFEQA